VGLELPARQYDLVWSMSSIPDKKVIVVYIGGRNRLLYYIPDIDIVVGILLAYQPGPMGGQAIVDIIRGRYNPSSRLLVSYPKYTDAQKGPYFHPVSLTCNSFEFSF
jgi:beta-glucosidase